MTEHELDAVWELHRKQGGGWIKMSDVRTLAARKRMPAPIAPLRAVPPPLCPVRAVAPLAPIKPLLPPLRPL